MTSKNKKIEEIVEESKKMDKRPGVLGQKIGVSAIALFTTLGVSLIVYTGIMAATYNTPTITDDFLTHEDVLADAGTSNDVETEEDKDVEKDVEEDVEDLEKDTEAEEDVKDEKETEDQDEEKTEEVDESTQFEGLVTMDNVRIRREPRTGADALGQVNEGDTITVLDSEYNAEWIQVQFEGLIGFVFAEFVERNE